MFNFSGINKNYSLGIDFGTFSIKIVELEKKNGSICLSNYGWIEIPKKKNIGDFGTKINIDEDDKMSSLLKKLCSEMDIKSKEAFISMGSYKGLSALINVSNTDGSDLNDIIRFEAGKYIPVSLDGVYLSSDIVSISDNEGDVSDDKKSKFFSKKLKGNAEVLLVAAPKDDVHTYERIVQASGLKVASFELDIFSVCRSMMGDNLNKFLIVDIGAKITNIIFVAKGIIRINRSINIGGDEITKNIASSLNVSWERAEEFKKNNDYLSAEGKNIILPIISIIAKESRRVIDLNSSADKNDSVGVIVTGGSSSVPSVVSIFSENVGSPVTIGNPWKNILIENDNLKEEATNIGPMYAVATGLALKGLNVKK
jgi:type IV pilus assembly protein PilM